MNDGQSWLTVEQFGRLEPHLPRDTRGKPRVDDRRVISGIVHVLKSVGRWPEAPPVYGPQKTLYNRFVRWAAKGRRLGGHRPCLSGGGWPTGRRDDRLHGGARPSFGERRQWGERTQAIGRPRGGGTIKIRALRDPCGQPLAFLLTGGQVADCTVADRLLDQMPATDLLHGDKSYDSAAIRPEDRREAWAAPIIPALANKRWTNCFSPYLHQNHDVIKSMFGRLKDLLTEQPPTS